MLIKLQNEHGQKIHAEVGRRLFQRPLRFTSETTVASPEYMASHAVAAPFRSRLCLDLPNTPADRRDLRDAIHFRDFYGVGLPLSFSRSC